MQGVRTLPPDSTLTIAGIAPAALHGQHTSLPAGPTILYADPNAAAVVRSMRRAAHCGVRPPTTSAHVLESTDSTAPPTDGVVYLWSARARYAIVVYDMGSGAWETFKRVLYRDAIATRGRPGKVLATRGRTPRLGGGLVPRVQHAWDVWRRTTQRLYGSEQAHLRELLAAAHAAWQARRPDRAAFEEAAAMTRLQRAYTSPDGDEDLFAVFAYALAPEHAAARCRATESLGRWVAAFLPEVALVVPYGDEPVWWVHGHDLELTGHGCAVGPDGRICVALARPRVLRPVQPDQLAASTPWVWRDLPEAEPEDEGVGDEDYEDDGPDPEDLLEEDGDEDEMAWRQQKAQRLAALARPLPLY